MKKIEKNFLNIGPYRESMIYGAMSRGVLLVYFGLCIFKAFGQSEILLDNLIDHSFFKLYPARDGEVEVFTFKQKKQWVSLSRKFYEEKDILDLRQDILDRFSDSVLSILKRGLNGKVLYRGGMIRVGKNLFLTNKHALLTEGSLVTCSRTQISIENPNINAYFSCNLLGCLAFHDACFVELRSHAHLKQLLDLMPVLKLGRIQIDKSNQRTGGELVQVGNSDYGIVFSICQGAIRVAKYLSYECATTHGMSGGALFNSDDHVVGLVFAKKLGMPTLEHAHGYSLDMSVFIPRVRVELGEEIYNQLSLTPDLQEWTDALFD